MTGPDRPGVFLESFDTGLPEDLDRLARDCEARQLPVLRPRARTLLRVLLAMNRPVRILEIGTCEGFSALLMCRFGPENMHLTTIESDPARAAAARHHFSSFGEAERITLLEGDAGALLPSLSSCYDMIFLDAAKGQYIHWLPELLRLMRTGSILVSDNVLQEGSLMQSRFLIPRRDRTIHERMREFLFRITHDPGLETVILPVGDGIALSVAKGMAE